MVELGSQLYRARERRSLAKGRWFDLSSSARELVMEYQGSLVKHLGLSMYGGAVPSVAELIANSWDADAKNVNVAIPFNRSLKPEDVISVSDDGIGMTWDDCQNLYLQIGLDRRQRAGKDRTASGRRVMGHKGIGKLAGFGIAKIIEVKTVKDGQLTHFSMDFDDITKAGEGGRPKRYKPHIIADQKTSLSAGTTIFLRNLQVSRAIPREDFVKSMSRRFSIFSNRFKVKVDRRELVKEDIALQMRFPETGVSEETVPGFGVVRFWFGFTEKPITQEDARGIAVMVRDKMAQVPFFFNIRGGVHGQHGLEYMTGEVYADQLDAEHDYVGTDRQGIIWSDPLPNLLLGWGQQKVRDILSEWLPRRVKKNEVTIYDKIVFSGNVKLEERLRGLDRREQLEAREVIGRLSTVESITDDLSRATSLIDLILRAFEDSSFFDLIKALSSATQQERAEILRLVTEFDVFETVKLAEVVRGRLGVITQLRRMIDQNVPEKPDMQDFLFKHPWLINPQWTLVDHEKRLETLLINHFKLTRSASETSKKRVDFFCISVRGYYLIVEVKRPGIVIGKQEIQQIMDYIAHLQQRAPNTPATENSPALPAHYSGILVGHSLSSDGAAWQSHANKAGVTIKTWDQLFDDAERIHRDFFEAIAERSPEDARVRSLSTDLPKSDKRRTRSLRPTSSKGRTAKRPRRKKASAQRRA